MKFNLHNTALRFENKYEESIFLATKYDLKKIQSDLYPKMSTDYDHRYFNQLQGNDVDCFLCEQDGKLIHYSFIFYNLLISPIAKTPMGAMSVSENNVFWGPTFTVPEARGNTYPYIFSKIVKFLRHKNKYDYIINFAYKKNRGAITYYKRLGFIELENQPKPTWIIIFLRTLDSRLTKNKK